METRTKSDETEQTRSLGTSADALIMTSDQKVGGSWPSGCIQLTSRNHNNLEAKPILQAEGLEVGRCDYGVTARTSAIRRMG